MTRGFLKSNVEKHLNQNDIVILDSLNYIKGFRYEIFCLARTAKTPHCVVNWLFRFGVIQMRKPAETMP